MALYVCVFNCLKEKFREDVNVSPLHVNAFLGQKQSQGRFSFHEESYRNELFSYDPLVLKKQGCLRIKYFQMQDRTLVKNLSKNSLV